MKKELHYWFILLIETIGALIVLITVVPMYRVLLLEFDQVTPRTGNIVNAIISIILIQVPHWIKQNKALIPEVKHSNLFSTVVCFLGRIFLIFIGALISVVFFIRFKDLNVIPWKMTMLILVLFSMFCYSQDLEELGAAFKRKYPKGKKRRGDRRRTLRREADRLTQ